MGIDESIPASFRTGVSKVTGRKAPRKASDMCLDAGMTKHNPQRMGRKAHGTSSSILSGYSGRRRGRRKGDMACFRGTRFGNCGCRS